MTFNLQKATNLHNSWKQAVWISDILQYLIFLIYLLYIEKFHDDNNILVSSMYSI